MLERAEAWIFYVQRIFLFFPIFIHERGVQSRILTPCAILYFLAFQNFHDFDVIDGLDNYPNCILRFTGLVAWLNFAPIATFLFIQVTAIISIEFESNK